MSENLTTDELVLANRAMRHEIIRLLDDTGILDPEYLEMLGDVNHLSLAMMKNRLIIDEAIGNGDPCRIAGG